MPGGQCFCAAAEGVRVLRGQPAVRVRLDGGAGLHAAASGAGGRRGVREYAGVHLLLRALQRGRAGVREDVPAVQLCGGQRAVRGNLQAGGPVQPRVRLPEKRGDGAEPVPHGV